MQHLKHPERMYLTRDALPDWRALRTGYVTAAKKLESKARRIFADHAATCPKCLTILERLAVASEIMNTAHLVLAAIESAKPDDNANVGIRALRSSVTKRRLPENPNVRAAVQAQRDRTLETIDRHGSTAADRNPFVQTLLELLQRLNECLADLREGTTGAPGSQRPKDT